MGEPATQKKKKNPGKDGCAVSFWLVPGAGNEDPLQNPAGRGRLMDIQRQQLTTKVKEEHTTLRVMEQRVATQLV